MNKAEKAKAYREELKAEGYCPRCYKRKAVAGKLHCKECEKYYYAYYHAHKAQRLEYAKQRREKLKAAGLCTQCGKRQQEKRLRAPTDVIKLDTGQTPCIFFEIF